MIAETNADTGKTCQTERPSSPGNKAQDLLAVRRPAGRRVFNEMSFIPDCGRFKIKLMFKIKLVLICLKNEFCHALEAFGQNSLHSYD